MRNDLKRQILVHKGKPATLEYIAKLSRPENNKCTYHVQLPQAADQQMTDIAIINGGVTNSSYISLDRPNTFSITLEQP